MSNRIQFAVHHDANVHLSPRDRLDILEVALVADEARLRVCVLGCAAGHRCRHDGYGGGGVNTAKMSVITSRLTTNLEVIKIKTEVITNPARIHCFPSRFDHRANRAGTVIDDREGLGFVIFRVTPSPRSEVLQKGW